ncbi:hypothetical protein GCM10009836_46680 [Pseudonocardia ailaonensis]|uniref:Phytase-like domain-containing protein n=1 Tax=Pseudonocardia ailaonensis TaxID=367279 RepID=A0ABN2NEY1_9PSEU
MFVSRLAGMAPVISLRRFSVPIFVADPGTKRYSIAPTAPYAPAGTRLDDVPVPANAAADPAEDGHLAVLDRDNRCIYEFFRAKPQGDGWTADWVNATPSDGTGIYPDGLGTRAAGFSIAAGLIWPDELRRGEIDHALVFAYPFTKKGGYVAPATRSDGLTTQAGALPIGSRLRLDPTIDLDKLTLTPQERTVARALQTYGMFLGDTSGGLTLYGVQPLSFAADPYQSFWNDGPWADIKAIPFDRLQVLDSGAEQPPYTGPPIGNRCTGHQG